MFLVLSHGFMTRIFHTDFSHGFLTRIFDPDLRFKKPILVAKFKKSPKLHLGGGVTGSYFQDSFRAIRQVLKQNQGHVRLF